MVASSRSTGLSLRPSVVPDDGVRLALGDLLLAVLQQRGEGLAVKDVATGCYVLADARLAEVFGLTAKQMIDHTDAELLAPEQAQMLRAADQTALAHGQPLLSEHRVGSGEALRDFTVLRTVGEVEGRQVLSAVWCDAAPQRQHEAQLQAALAQIEQQQRTNDLLRRDLADQALRDRASGLYRGAHFEEQLRRELDLSTREHREFAIVFIELDPAAAEVLALGDAGSQRVFEAMGRLLRGGTRAMDASCRFSDRRFGVLLSGVGLATAHARMESLRRKCASEIVVHDGGELGFTVSTGVASYPHTALAQDALVAACEAALTEAQRRGGNHVQLAAIRFDAEQD
ncbi:MAG: diguanylate cyclase [Pseudomonadota bacterium]|nr:diguanylate cyclase [Pseudomonadota bacterium]